MTALKAPFPYFGGKSKVAAEVWRHFGFVDNYVEPFFGSGAVLLARPDPRGLETVNDADGMISNFWRAIKSDPEAVAHWADWPVNETDLEARHYWLVTEGRRILAERLGDPDGYDAKVAGWWVWGICAWIGGGWCSGDGPWKWTGTKWAKKAVGPGIDRRRPHLGDAGHGIHRRRAGCIASWFDALSRRLRGVRVTHGDWSRVISENVTWRNGVTAVFCDPPYSHSQRNPNIYAQETDCAADVREWAIEAGKRPDMRICLAGYDGEHAMPGDWFALRWQTQGGYANQGKGRGRINAGRETLWFSPACVGARQVALDL